MSCTSKESGRSEEDDESGEEDENSDEEVSGMILPSLIRQLKNVLDQYPDDGQILKELIQNAEDAGAKQFRVVYDGRQSVDIPDSTASPRDHAHALQLQSPALCVYNDALFTKKDWRGIRMLHTSVKEDDRLKVGRFGLGLKSVFHITDSICVVSGKKIIFINPHERDLNAVCHLMHLKKMSTFLAERCLRAMGGLFGFGPEVLKNDSFPGTLFWLPLRQRETELSGNLYDESKILLHLFHAFRAEAPSLLLFLRHIESVELHVKAASLDGLPAVGEDQLLQVFSLALTGDCLDSMRQERGAFSRQIQALTDDLPSRPVQGFFRPTVELTWVNADGTKSSSREPWLVAVYYSDDEVSEEFAALCRDKALSYCPLMGLASPLSSASVILGHVFCFLPLPLQSESPTGLPVHVNGFFALSQNRRYVKWPTADQEGQTLTDRSLLWNQGMLREVLPPLYAGLLATLVATTGDPDLVYHAAPDPVRVRSEWSGFLPGLFGRLGNEAWAHTRQEGGGWVAPRDAILAALSPGLPPELEDKVMRAVEDVYLELGQSVVRVPAHVQRLLRECGCTRETTAEDLGRLLQARSVPDGCDASARVLLLDYLMTSCGPPPLQGLPLLPTADGEFRPFAQSGGDEVTVYVSSDIDLLRLLPGLNHQLLTSHLRPALHDRLEELAREGTFQLRVFSKEHMPYLLHQTMISHPEKISMEWLRYAWSEITRLFGRDLHSFEGLSLVPECDEASQIKAMHGMKDVLLCRAVEGMKPLDSRLSSALEHLAVTVLPTLPDFILQNGGVLGKYVQYPNSDGVFQCLRALSQTTTRCPVERFNLEATDGERDALVQHLSHRSDLADITGLLLTLALFKDTDGQPCCLEDNALLAPEAQLPCPFPWVLLDTRGDRARRDVALKLGAREVSVEDVMLEVLRNILHGNEIFGDVREEVMKFVMVNLLHHESILQTAKLVPFLRSRPGAERMRPDELFDPDCKELRELFEKEARFPVEFDSRYMNGLRMLGLRGVRDVTSQDIVITANRIEALVNEGDAETARSKALQMVTFLLARDSRGIQLDMQKLCELGGVVCWPCLTSRPPSYPEAMPFLGSGSQWSLARPLDVASGHAGLLGSVMPVTARPTDDVLAQALGLSCRPPEADVIQHLVNMVDAYDPEEHVHFMSMTEDLYEYFSRHCCQDFLEVLKTVPFVWTESGGFQTPDKVWMRSLSDDLQIIPFKYQLPQPLMKFEDLFRRVGVREHQTTCMLEEVLRDVQSKHADHGKNLISLAEVRKDTNLAILIVKKLSDAGGQQRDILVPVHVPHDARLVLRPASQCTVCDASWLLDDDTEEGTEGIDYVHRDIPMPLARRLGVVTLTNRVMVDVEGIDFNYGQKEPLTQRLHNLLRDYSDGLAVPKELVQNADDAGATVVKFLYDQRENRDARRYVVDAAYSECQGPALWAFNDGLFSEEDFRNITQLGGATKETCTTKIGRFGLGFNAVYNLTDIPTFASGSSFATFDPHGKFLGDGRGGLRVDMRKDKNREMVSKMKDQFKPFQGVFGCNIHPEGDYTVINGTLFRLPLRTAAQAKESRIKQIPYTEQETMELLQMLLDNAGSLLLFTQSVCAIEVHILPEGATDPSHLKLIGRFSKTFLKSSMYPKPVAHFDDLWKTSQGFMPEGSSHSIPHEIEISLSWRSGEVEEEKTCSWQISWALGTEQSAAVCRAGKVPGLLPIAAVGVPFQRGGDGTKTIMPLSDCPRGFSPKGFFSCFLPLPILSGLPVQVNASFAVTPNRRQLCVRTVDDKASQEAVWNEVLTADAVCRAYLQLLHSLSDTAMASERLYYSFWPSSSSILPDLPRHFFSSVVKEEAPVFAFDGRWTTFEDAVFLDPCIPNHDGLRDIMIKLMIQHPQSHGAAVVDLPAKIVEAFQTHGQAEALLSKTMHLDEFLEKIFLPHINDPSLSSGDRDVVLLYALMNGSENTHQLMAGIPCFPTSPNGTLRRPCDLVHPEGRAAPLFAEDEERFPAENFRRFKIMQLLEKLGMVKGDVPEEVVVERVASIQSSGRLDRAAQVKRCFEILVYLAKSEMRSRGRFYETLSDSTKETLSNMEFLPVCPKPDDWPCSWRGEDETASLAKPKQLYFMRCSELVGSCELVLDEGLLLGTMLSADLKLCLAWLGVQDEGSVTLEIATQQLLATTEASDLPAPKVRRQKRCCRTLYQHIDRCCSTAPEEVHSLKQALSNRPVLLINEKFFTPEKVVGSLKYDCGPHLVRVDAHLKRHSHFLDAIGVRAESDKNQVIEIFRQIRLQWGDGILPDDEIGHIVNLTYVLIEALRREGNDDRNFRNDLFLPDRIGRLFPLSQLCLDDTEWLKETETMRFIHERFPPETSKAIGVQSKRMHAVRRCKLPMKQFGQKERLPNRLKKILTGYPRDTSIMKEMIQNADDAGATVVKFLLDYRKHPTKRLMDDRLQPLQGPALCVFNDSFFTEKDLEGIQALGEGSKGEDLVKTGQFGVGFNAVYHLTDAPSFLTVGPGKPKRLCLLDPMCRYVPDSDSSDPGALFEDIEYLKESYPDQFACYPEEEMNLESQGTLFRFPLRTEEMARYSEICRRFVEPSNIRSLLQSLQDEAFDLLMFLKSVRCIEIYQIDKQGKLTLDFRSTSSMTDEDRHLHMAFYRHLDVEAKKMQDRDVRLEHMSPMDCTVTVDMENSKGEKESWLVVQKAGFSGDTQMEETVNEAWEKRELKVLPRAGVAVPLARTSGQGVQATGASVSWTSTPCFRKRKYRVFCTLPLPQETPLPVHVNGNFCLEYESRRRLCEKKNAGGTEWNRALVKGVVAPAFIRALEEVKSRWLGKHRKLSDAASVQSALDEYHHLFPDFSPEEETDENCLWTEMAKQMYSDIATKQLRLFPYLQMERCNEGQTKFDIQFASVISDSGFPGYFNDLPRIFVEEILSLEDSSKKNAGDQLRKIAQAEESARETATILKSTGMKILEAPMRIHDVFASIGSGVKTVTPEEAVRFLKTWTAEKDGFCKLQNLPRDLEDTRIRDVKSVAALLRFCRKWEGISDNLCGLPLLALADGQLDAFGRSDVYASPYLDLLPESAASFVHRNIWRLVYQYASDEGTGVKRLDVESFSRMLPNTLNPQNWQTDGKRLDVKDDEPGGKEWIRLLWEFLSQCLPQPHIIRDDRVTGEQLQQRLAPLRKWTLIPASQSEGEIILYTIESAWKIINNRNVPRALKKFSFPWLAKQFVQGHSWLPEALVASAEYPTRLFRLLTTVEDFPDLTLAEASELLSLFGRCMRQLCEAFPGKAALQSLVSHLRLFCAKSNTLTNVTELSRTLFIHGDMPTHGMNELGIELGRTLLNPDKTPESIRTFLGIKNMDVWKFYRKYVMPNFHKLPPDSRLVHLEYIKRHLSDPKNCSEELVQALKSMKFVEIPEGQWHTASDFYSPTVDVFRAMCPEKLPPRPFCSREWYTFMIRAGMINEVTADMFVCFAQQLAESCRESVTDEDREKSMLLVKHLFSRPKLVEENLLPRLKDVAFLPPLDLSSLKGAPELLTLHAQYPIEGLVSFSQSASSRHQQLVWTSTHMLHPVCDPRLPEWRWQHELYRYKAHPVNVILEQLDLQEDPSEETVASHARNICQRMESMETKDMKAKQRLCKEVMEALYTFMSKEPENFAALLAGESTIYLPEKAIVARPEDVVLKTSYSEGIEGYIHKAEIFFGKFFPLFQSFGVAERPTANMYARVLAKLLVESGDNPLSSEKLRVASAAISLLFDCMKSKNENRKTLTAPVVFFPDYQRVLKPSSTLVVANNRHVQERCKGHPFPYFIGFEELRVRGLGTAESAVALLPPHHRMKLLTEIVSEEAEEIPLTAASAGPLCDRYSRLMAKDDFQRGIVRVVCHHRHPAGEEGIEDTARQVQDGLSRVRFREVSAVKKVLLHSGERIKGSEVTVSCHCKKELDEGRNESMVVYMTSGALDQTRAIERCLAEALRDYLQCSQYGDRIMYHFEVVIGQWRDAEEISTMLDRERIRDIMFERLSGRTQRLPSAGTYIPTRFHCFLDHSFSRLDPEEQVGVCIFDPSIDEHRHRDQARTSEPGNSGDSDIQTPDSVCPVFVYGRVQRVLDEAAEELTVRYEVDTGEKNGVRVLPATRLFKFHRGTLSASLELRPQTEMKVIVEEVRRQVGAAQQLEPVERLRAVLRMLLKWHLECGNDKGTTRNTVTALISATWKSTAKSAGRAAAARESDQAAESSSSADDVGRLGKVASERGKSYRQLWDDFVRSHAPKQGASAQAASSGDPTQAACPGDSAQAVNPGDHSQGDSQGQGEEGEEDNKCVSWHRFVGSEANPQPGEAWRWLHHAQTQLTCALALNNGCQSCGAGLGIPVQEVLRLCLQATEMALRAARFKVDSRHASLQSHNFILLAQGTEVSPLVRQLLDITGDPEVIGQPDILASPGDPFPTCSQAGAPAACDLTSRILTSVKGVVTPGN